MPILHLPTTLQALAGGSESFDAAGGGTVAELLRKLEGAHPAVAGWVLDEQGALRRHVSVFVNDELAGAGSAVGPADEVYIVPAISGGVGDVGAEVEVLVGTRKGLFVLRGRRGGTLAVAARRFAGQPVEFALREGRSGLCFASVTHGHFGPHLFYSEDATAPDEEWRQASGLAFPAEAGASVEKIWVVEPGVEEGVLWAGVAPAALFRSADGGRSWELVRGLWDEPSRARWQPGFGGLCLHSICPWPGEPARLAIGISSAGVWLTEDGGASWRRGNRGLVPRYVPAEARATTEAFCVHKMLRAEREPATLYQQFHGGVYRSDDAGESWHDIGTGLPADFGFPLALDPRDPASAYVIPLVADMDRVTVGGLLRVYETRDRGGSWRALTHGLPQGDTYLTILRQGFGQDGGDPVGLYFGAESGDVYASGDGGETWCRAAEGLPPIHSVRASQIA